MKNRILKGSALAVIAALLGVRPAFAAYLDPNTGGMLFQLLAVLFGVISGFILFFAGRIKMFFFKVMRLIRGSKAGVETEESVSD